MFNRLLDWYKLHGRTLPWRHTTDPYCILVSEVMLQQTQVSRVIDYYHAWLKRFPDWQVLAHATKEEVIRSWSGLGYNRRALILHNIAKHIDKNGVPASEEEWLQLKGIGPYTAAALTVFSLRQYATPIDTNIRRVLGRAWLGVLFPTRKTDKRLLSRMRREMKSTVEFYDIPQALFDLANTHCLKIPNCAACPLKDVCKSSERFLTGDIRIPKKQKKSFEKIREGKKYPDRIYRGRILRVVQNMRYTRETIGNAIDDNYACEDQAWVNAMVDRMIRDGLLTEKNKKLTLPK